MPKTSSADAQTRTLDLFPPPPEDQGAWRQTGEKDGWRAELSSSSPLGFAADRLTAYVNLDGLQQEPTQLDAAPEAVVQIRVSRNNTRWSEWMQLAWFGAPEHQPGSHPATPGEWSAGISAQGMRVDTDELIADSTARFRFVQLRLLTRGGVRAARVGFTARLIGDQNRFEGQFDISSLPDAPPRHRPRHVPQFDVPGIGHLICSPISVLMALQAFDLPGCRWTPEDACARVLDHQADIYGNWTRAVQLAYEGGADAWMEYFPAMEPVVEHLREGRLVIASISFKEGELTHAPRPWSKGHLCLLTGYDAKKGELIACDSAHGASSPPPHRYDVREFARVWLGRKALGYIIAPRG